MKTVFITFAFLLVGIGALANDVVHIPTSQFVTEICKRSTVHCAVLQAIQSQLDPDTLYKKRDDNSETWWVDGPTRPGDHYVYLIRVDQRAEDLKIEISCKGDASCIKPQ